MARTVSTALPGPRRHSDTPDTTAEFAEMARLPEGAAKDRVQERVIVAWLPLAHRLARGYRDRGETLEDLQQVAALALVKSVERYDPAHGTSFLSYALPTIRGELKRHFRDHMWQTHVPRRVQNLRNKVRDGMRDLEATSPGRTPSLEELAEQCGLCEADVRAGAEALHGFAALSLDAPPSPKGDEPTAGQWAGALGSDEPGYDHVVDREAAKTYLSDLSEREQLILYLRFFHELYQREIADFLGISQMHVSRLLTDACRQVRVAVDKDAHTRQS